MLMARQHVQEGKIAAFRHGGRSPIVQRHVMVGTIHATALSLLPQKMVDAHALPCLRLDHATLRDVAKTASLMSGRNGETVPSRVAEEFNGV